MQQATPTTPSLNKKRHSQLWQLAMALMLSWGLLALSPHVAEAAFDCGSVTEIPVAQCEALVALYSANGPSWFRKDNWLVTTTPCSWYGIACTSETTPRHVSGIVLSLNNLSGNIPAEIGNLSSLQTLYLDDNKLRRLPLEFVNLSSLRELDLSENQLSSLPLEFDNLSNLTYLNLYANQLVSVRPEIGNLTNLSSLYLSYNQLSSLPPEIGNLTNLYGLDLSQNKLSGLPTEIGNLTNLSSLNLSSNQLSSVPAEIGNLTSLQGLNLFGNQLSSVPPEFGNLSTLQILNLTSNQLRSVPPEFGNLDNLQELSLSYNQLSSLPPEIGNLSSLQSLVLYANQLSSLPAEIGNLSNLQELHLSYNQLSSLPSEIGNLSSLQYLFLGSNQLSSVPPEIGNLSSLQSLDLGFNQLSSLPPEIGNLSNLLLLYLRFNSSLAGPLPAWLLQLTALQRFVFSDTNLCEPGDAAFQSWLANIRYLSRTDVICSPPTASIVVTKTVGLVPDVCSDTSNLTVAENTTVYYCYTVHNLDTITFTQHTLEDSHLGSRVFDVPLPPGATLNTVEQGFTLSATLDITTTNVVTWTARPYGYEVASATASATVNVIPSVVGGTGSEETELHVPEWVPGLFMPLITTEE